MGTNIRPEIDKSNTYYISKHRYYELKHFCLQYYEWKELYSKLYPKISNNVSHIPGSNRSNPTESIAIALAEYSKNMELIEKTCTLTDKELSNYIFMAVTKGLTYTNLQMMHNIPCCRDTFYDRYRRFFWILNSSRR